MSGKATAPAPSFGVSRPSGRAMEECRAGVCGVVRHGALELTLASCDLETPALCMRGGLGSVW